MYNMLQSVHCSAHGTERIVNSSIFVVSSNFGLCIMALNDSTQEIALVLLEKLKANGTFDEFRKFCVSDIDAKVIKQII